jgi:hypothetical protein
MVADIRPVGCLGKSAKNSATAKTMAPAAIARKQKPVVLAPKVQRLTHCMSSTRGSTGATTRRAHNSNYHGHLYTSIFGLVWIFSRPLRQTKGLFCGRFGLATNYGSASNWAPLFRLAWAHMQAARPDQLDRLYPRGLNQPPTCTRGYLVSGKLAEEIRKNLVIK